MLGVVGGLGPGATANFMDVLVERTPAERDQDHIRTLVYNDPTIPPRGPAILGDGTSPVPALVRAAERLDWLGCETIVIASNTTHYFHEHVDDAVQATVPYLPDLVDDAVDSDRVGVLTTEAAVETGLYDHVAPEVVYPPDVDRLERAIAAVKAGELEAARGHYRTAIETFDPSVEAYVVACTDLSMLEWPLDADPVDAAEVMAEYCISRHHQ